MPVVLALRVAEVGRVLGLFNKLQTILGTLVRLSQKVKKKIKTNPEVDTVTWLSNFAFAWCVQGPDVSQPPGSRNN